MTEEVDSQEATEAIPTIGADHEVDLEEHTSYRHCSSETDCKEDELCLDYTMDFLFDNELEVELTDKICGSREGMNCHLQGEERDKRGVTEEAYLTETV